MAPTSRAKDYGDDQFYARSTCATTAAAEALTKRARRVRCWDIARGYPIQIQLFVLVHQALTRVPVHGIRGNCLALTRVSGYSSASEPQAPRLEGTPERFTFHAQTLRRLPT